MKILLYNPDNGVTRNFMPHLWMFLLQSLTPPGHEVTLIDGNAQPMNEESIARYVREHNIELVGIGAMTRMIAKAYRMADAVRAAGAKVVMGGPHVTEMADEALGRDGGPRHADAVALGEADETWPKIVEDAARGTLKDVYAPVDAFGQEHKPPLQPYPEIPWDKINLDQFNLLPGVLHPVLKRVGGGWGTFRIIPVESGRGCPYGCEFCTVTGFFGDSIRFRTNESVVNELLLLKARAKAEGGQIAVFFIDDNFAINIKRTKSLLRDIIAANAQVHWVAQISANLLRDEELVDLIAASGGKWVFIGMESIDPVNLADVKKGFNKPGEYATVLERLAQRNVYAITSFIFGMDNDTVGVAERTLKEIRNWPPGLPIFGLLTPLPATPLYKRLEAAGRLTRVKHWQEFIPFAMAHTPLKMSIEEAHNEVRMGWSNAYSPKAIEKAVDSLNCKPLGYRINILVARLCFRGIYFPQMGRFAWVKTIIENRRTIFKLLWQGFGRGLHAAAPSVAAETVAEPQSGD
ncbi:MAG TPA: cobalamin-dependent protein [Candidatus Acidoferrales bacterium]|nr:cobalamin-dependent protein [Candidatus Acidoferrales bacterium]